jgi:glycerol-1-phosphate dehydrogenase [NAD(P)+]
MELHQVKLPKDITIGKNATEKIGQICDELDMRESAIIFTDEAVMEAAGKKVIEVLRSYDYDVYPIFLPRKVEMKDLKAVGSDFIIGLGGGRVVDFAKMTAKISRKPFISFPTAISHDGIASDRAVVGDSYSVPAVIPDAIVIDTDIILKSPYRLTAAGCGDVIAKLTAVKDWKLSHEKTGEYISEYSAAINRTSADIIIDSASSIRNLEIRGIRNLIEALVFSGVSMSIAGSSRPSSGSEHLFSHALKTIYPERKSLHGEECAIGAILCSYLHEANWERIVNALKRLGLPTNSKELGVPENIIVEALCKAKDVRNDRYTILNDKEVNEETARNVARETGVIE